MLLIKTALCVATVLFFGLLGVNQYLTRPAAILKPVGIPNPVPDPRRALAKARSVAKIEVEVVTEPKNEKHIQPHRRMRGRQRETW